MYIKNNIVIENREIFFKHFFFQILYYIPIKMFVSFFSNLEPICQSKYSSTVVGVY